MENAKVYTTNLRTYGTTSLLDKLEKLVRAAGIETLPFQDRYAAIKVHFGEPGNLSFLLPGSRKTCTAACYKIVPALCKIRMKFRLSLQISLKQP